MEDFLVLKVQVEVCVHDHSDVFPFKVLNALVDRCDFWVNLRVFNITVFLHWHKFLFVNSVEIGSNQHQRFRALVQELAILKIKSCLCDRVGSIHFFDHCKQSDDIIMLECSQVWHTIDIAGKVLVKLLSLCALQG